MTVHPLPEGTFTVGHDKLFAPFNLKKDELTERFTGSLLVEVQPFLLLTENEVILLDAGLGFNSAEGKLMIHENLAKLGFNSSDVTKILMSHLHKDHAGGLVSQNAQGEFELNFPKAKHYIYKKEFDFALEKGRPSYFPDELEFLSQQAQIGWLEKENDHLIEGLSYFWSGAHCPHHIVFLIDDREGKIFYGGDEAPMYKQMKMKYVAKYDHDGQKAMQWRKQWAEQGLQENWLFLFYHDFKKPMARL